MKTAYLNISAKAIITSKAGKLTFNKLNSVEIKSTWKELTSTATVTVPRNMQLKGKRVEEYIHRGDKIEIWLGYNGELYQEFTGWVVEVEPNEPLTISCEDEMFQLKKKSFTKSWSSITLKSLLAYIAPGYPIETFDTTLYNFQVENATPARVLEELQEKYRFYSYFRDGKLFCGFPYASKFKQVTYSIKGKQGNVKKNDLKYKSAEATKIKVRAVAKQQNGKELKVEVGDAEGELRELKFGWKMSEAELKAQANAELKMYKYDGYRGTLTGFGWPRALHGDQAKLIDEKYPEREGTLIIDKVTIKVAPVMYEREVELGPRV